MVEEPEVGSNDHLFAAFLLFCLNSQNPAEENSDVNEEATRLKRPESKGVRETVFTRFNQT